MAKLKLIVDMVNERTRMVADLSTLLTIESKLVSRDVRTRSSFSCGSLNERLIVHGRLTDRLVVYRRSTWSSREGATFSKAHSRSRNSRAPTMPSCSRTFCYCARRYEFLVYKSNVHLVVTQRYSRLPRTAKRVTLSPKSCKSRTCLFTKSKRARALKTARSRSPKSVRTCTPSRYCALSLSLSLI